MAPADVARLGLVRSFQISAVFPHLTALENVRSARAAQQRAPLTISSAVKCGNTAEIWNERTRPSRATSAGAIAVISLPLYRICPAEA